jgi:hypothetical protein
LAAEENLPPSSLSTQPSLHPSTPPLPALILSASEYKVSGGKSKVSRLMGLPRNPHVEAPKMASPLFLVASRDSCCVAMVEPPVSYLASTVPATTCEMAIVFRSADYAYFTCRVPSLRAPSPSSATSFAISFASLPLYKEEGHSRRAEGSC